MIRIVLLILVAVFVVWCGTTVKLGEHTCLGHVTRIWDSEETRDLRKGIRDKATSEGTKELVDDIKEEAEPVVERAKRGWEAGVKEATKGDAKGGAAGEAKAEKETDGAKPTE